MRGGGGGGGGKETFQSLCIESFFFSLNTRVYASGTTIKEWKMGNLSFYHPSTKRSAFVGYSLWESSSANAPKSFEILVVHFPSPVYPQGSLLCIYLS